MTKISDIESSRDCKEKNKEIINAKQKEYFRAYRKKNKEIINAKQKEHRKKNKEIINAKQKERSRIYREKNKKIINVKQKERYRFIKNYIAEMKTKCANCSETDKRLLDFAHYDRKNKSGKLSAFRTINKVNTELLKGRFLCIKCHRQETFEEYDLLRKNIDIMIEKIREEALLAPKEPDDNTKICRGQLCRRVNTHGVVRSKHRFRRDASQKDNLCVICKDCAYINQKKTIDTRYKYVFDEKLRVGQCALCELQVSAENYYLFEFDHVNHQNKTLEISKMIASSYHPLAKIKAEITKCQLLCCNCHRIKTIQERQIF